MSLKVNVKWRSIEDERSLGYLLQVDSILSCTTIDSYFVISDYVATLTILPDSFSRRKPILDRKTLCGYS